jgi:transcriptional antiterminator RfaH
MTRKWFVVRTNRNGEYLAATELTGDGLETYSPTIKTTKPRNGHTDSPMFPGYIFVRCDTEINGWPLLRRSGHVLGWVRFGTEVPSIPDEAIEGLRERLTNVNFDGGEWRRYEPGELVQVVSDTVEGLARVVERAKSPQARVKVLLSFMGGFVPAQIPWENLRPTEKSPSHEPSRQRRRTRGRGRWIQGLSGRTPSTSLAADSPRGHQI